MLNLKYVVILVISIGLTNVFAQTLKFGVGATAWNKNTTDLQSEVFVGVNDIDFKDSKLSFRIATNVITPLEFGLGAQYNFSWGPFGNVLLKSLAQVDSDGLVDIDVSASGVLGSLAALEADLMLFNANKGHFALESAYRQARPRYDTSSLVFGVGLGGKYRLERTLVLEFKPTLVLTAGSLGGYGSVGLHLRHLIERDDGIIKFKAEKSPTTSDAYGAIGFEYRLNRRNLPTVQVTAWLATGTEGTFPGGALNLKHKLKGQPVRYEVELFAEPYRFDGFDYGASALLVVELELGELEFQVLGAPDNEGSLPELAVQVGYSWHF